jgi:hypothetical protein
MDVRGGKARDNCGVTKQKLGLSGSCAEGESRCVGHRALPSAFDYGKLRTGAADDALHGGRQMLG